ncbi:MAG: hypothetical protein ACR2ND_10810 [Solirubrobacteraceae bacterium]
MNRFRLTRVGAVGIASAALGVGAGAAALGSASAAGPHQPTAHQARLGGKGGGKRGGRGPLKLLRRAVHADAVIVANGGKFVPVTFDRGIVQSVAGNQLTLTEGTKQASYKTVTLTVPADAIVHNDRALSQLSSIKPGQRAFVFVGPKHTRVGAFTVK